MDINDADGRRSGAHAVLVTCATMQGDSPPEEWGHKEHQTISGRKRNMTIRTTLTATVATAAIATAGAAFADGHGPMRIGITQNNVGVDSYQTTYEQAFIAAAEANDNVEVVVLDAGGDVARQIAQMEDLIQQEVDAIIIWPTNGEAVIPAVRKAAQADIPVVVTNSNIAEAGFDFVASFSGPDNITHDLGRA